MKNIQQNNLPFLSLFALSALFSTNLYAEQCLAPQQLIEKIFNLYVIKENSKSLQNENISILKKYFSKSLATKIDHDNKCQERTDFVCNLDFNILTNAQDTPENPRYQFKTLNSSQVQVKITGINYRRDIVFEFSKDNGCPKINDILYSKHTRLSKSLK